MMLLATVAFGQQTLDLSGAVVDDGTDFIFLPFEVPVGTAELQVDHTSESFAVLDWGLQGPDGTSRGWGGGNGESVWINADGASRSYLPGVPSGVWNVVVGKARLVEGPMPYSVDVRLLEHAVSTGEPREPYVAAAPLESGARWFAGDLHVHSIQSGDARATLDEIGTLARERGLDFVVVTDHNTTSSLDFLTAAQRRHPDVLFVPGMEFTTYAGHLNAIGTTVPLRFLIGVDGASVGEAISTIQANGGVASVNHPTLDLGSLCIGCAWEHPLSVGTIDAVEIQTGGLRPVGALFTEASLDFWTGVSTANALPAAVGGSDDHKAGQDLGFQDSPIGSPTTLVYADDLSVASIVAGLRAGRTVVKLQGPEDPMVELSLDEVGVEARVTGRADAVRFVVDGVVQPDVGLVNGSARLALVPADQIVRAEAWSEGERRTVTSHQLHTAAEVAAGCGCSSAGRRGWCALWSRRR